MGCLLSCIKRAPYGRMNSSQPSVQQSSNTERASTERIGAERANADSAYDYSVKMILVGPPMSGKTTMLDTITDRENVGIYKETIGVNLGTRTISNENKKIKFQIWDTSGNSTCDALVAAYYYGSAIVVIVYKADEENTEEIFKKYFTLIDQYCSSDVIVNFIRNSPGENFSQDEHLNFGSCITNVPHFTMDVASKEQINMFFDGLINNIKPFIKRTSCPFLSTPCMQKTCHICLWKKWMKDRYRY
jgi:small GTP-binding protein